MYCLKRKEPVVMTAGEYGTGKTLLCLKLIQFMEKNRLGPMVYIPSPGYSFSMLLEKIARELGLAVDAAGPEASQRFIYDYFENDPPERNKYVSIIIDDIQEFDHAFISSLTKLITYNNYGYFPLRLFMFGHSGFLKSLDQRNFVSFRQRIKRVALNPLGIAEVTEYIYFRLISSGASGSPVFNEQAIELITSASRGLPRLINKICDASLVMAYKKRANFIDHTVVEAALVDAGIIPDKPPLPVPPAPVRVREQEPEKPTAPVSPPPAPEKDTTGAADAGNAPETASRRSRGDDLFEVPDDNGAKKAKRKKQKPKDLKPGMSIDGKTILIACLVMIIVLMFLFLFSGRQTPVTGWINGNTGAPVIMRSIPASTAGKTPVLITKPVVRVEDGETSGTPHTIMDARINSTGRVLRPITFNGLGPVTSKPADVEIYNVNG